MVSVAFDPSALGPVPTEPQPPTEPVKPEGYVPAEPPAEPAPPPEQDAPPTPAPDPRDPSFVLYDEQMAQFKLAQQQYEIERDDYQRQLEDYNKRRDEGQAKSKRLAERFGPWFYVISANDLDLLQIPRGDLVSVKQKEGGETTEPLPGEVELPPRPDLSY
jgi:hypothetical protein